MVLATVRAYRTNGIKPMNMGIRPGSLIENND